MSEYIQQVLSINMRAEISPLAFVEVFGCQQNEADGEILRGLLSSMGYGFTDRQSDADLVLLNTCAIREHAEQRALGHLGKLVHQRKPNQKIVVCGCMAQQESVREKLRKSYRHVSLTFGPSALPQFPQFLYELLTEGKRIFVAADATAGFTEGLPVLRTEGTRAYIPIMHGCNNFCTYCVVPYVRGREQSRGADAVIAEARAVIAEGYSEIWLLGQNVNSYSDGDVTFPKLLEALSNLEGDFHLRFMTSHPKDAGAELFDVITRCDRVAKFLHLPVQSGSSRILKAMNRGYTHERYLELIKELRRAVPNINITSDIIVGFPGETDEDFEQTLELLKEVRFNCLFTFIYSPRDGTPAALLADKVPPEVTKERFARLQETQRVIENR